MTTTQYPKSVAAVSPELRMSDHWNSDAIRTLINRKTADGRKPAFLFLGQHEAHLLRDHLGHAFGSDSVKSLNNVYYMGLQVREVDAPAYIRAAGTKRVEGLMEALNRFPTHHDLEASNFWHYAVL